MPPSVPTSSSSGADADDAPAVRYLQKILLDAIRLGASDLHLEPFEHGCRLRFRIDGALRDIAEPPLSLRDKLASRIKVLARLDIAEKRVPQDGRMKLTLSKSHAVQFRVSTLPTLFGEKVVMRVLDATQARLDLSELGYAPAQESLLREAITRPHGMVLMTGPTGSGKTVSLYSCLHLLNQPGVNISTIEDPVEIPLPGINQVNVNERAGLSFPTALRAFLRQDPDIMMVGEIRDLETADIAVKAAQTGHLVLSTLHTNDAPATLTRLLNMGVPAFNIASSVIMITAQRLVRRLCSCKQEHHMTLAARQAAGMTEAIQSSLSELSNSGLIFKPNGCKDCGGSGYRGRTGIYQVMPISNAIESLILAHAATPDIAAQAQRDGVLSLRQSGWKKVAEGMTSVDEIIACTGI
ncbi:type IV pilus assembly protein PilB [Herbaspirillum sp. Sphag1AN]|nr:type IV pilus assembly protein PilB [Herbaspirillum sp. Sphag1AN]MBB3246948.1 type IV pilus assembly protein PilB [Herbaspirillum sp. Sphag64]